MIAAAVAATTAPADDIADVGADANAVDDGNVCCDIFRSHARDVSSV